MKEYILGLEEKISSTTLLITGACRSGKTLLSRLLASLHKVEWIEEPLAPVLLTELAGLNIISKDVYCSLLKSIVLDLMYDNVLLRNGNFRPDDLSTVWNFKSQIEIFNRLVNVKTRDEAIKYVDSSDTYFILDIPEILPFTNLFRQCFDNLIVVNVVRNGFGVIQDVVSKKWFNDIVLEKGYSNYLYKQEKYQGLRIPWWVKNDDEKKFVEGGEVYRGELYWTEMNNYYDLETEKIDTQYDIIIKYEDIILNPEKVLDDLGRYISVKKTQKTASVIAGFDKNCVNINNKFDITSNKFRKLMEYNGYGKYI